MHRHGPGRRASVAIAAVLVVSAAVGYWVWTSSKPAKSDIGATTSANAEPSVTGTPVRDPHSVDLSESQLVSVKVAPVEDREFRVEKDAVGSIDFNEDMQTQVFTPYQGRIINLFAEVGDDVKKGQTLFTIDSPDLLQAESTLISAAG
ncbi:MAG TPA: efflux RND transporter periplasmic adaptor subunit, partial [Xanthobacteraceae bacterium]|nr:efflux RND transporter periplasmic adaptor subunit [Xanthobacteraceae bacterium]